MRCKKQIFVSFFSCEHNHPTVNPTSSYQIVDKQAREKRKKGRCLSEITTFFFVKIMTHFFLPPAAQPVCFDVQSFRRGPRQLCHFKSRHLFCGRSDRRWECILWLHSVPLKEQLVRSDNTEIPRKTGPRAISTGAKSAEEALPRETSMWQFQSSENNSLYCHVMRVWL